MTLQLFQGWESFTKLTAPQIIAREIRANSWISVRNKRTAKGYYNNVSGENLS